MWFRIGKKGWGLSFSKAPLLFSERYGYTWYLRLPFGYKMNILKPSGGRL